MTTWRHAEYEPDPPSQIIAASLTRAEQAARAIRPRDLAMHERRSLASSLYRMRTVAALLNQALAQAEEGPNYE